MLPYFSPWIRIWIRFALKAVFGSASKECGSETQKFPAIPARHYRISRVRPRLAHELESNYFESILVSNPRVMLAEPGFSVKGSVVDPDPVGSSIIFRIRIRND